MFLTKRFHRELIAEQRERFEAQLYEKERVITALAEQVDWLRAILGRPALVQQQSVNPTDQPLIREGTRLFMTEMEEEIEHHRRSGLLTEDQAEEALAEFGGGLELDTN